MILIYFLLFVKSEVFAVIFRFFITIYYEKISYLVSCDGASNGEVIEICGMGADSCTGSFKNHVCNCDKDKYYVRSKDRSQCVLGTSQTSSFSVETNLSQNLIYSK